MRPTAPGSTSTAPITEPGVYYDLPADVYRRQHAWVSWSTLKRLVPPSTPAHLQAARRAPEERKRHFDLGKVVHAIILGTGDEFEVVRSLDRKKVARDATDYTTVSAQAHRDEIYEAGKVPVLRAELDRAHKMAESVIRHDAAHELLTNGSPEVSLFWVDPATGVKCRARLDWLPAPSARRLTVPDLKTSPSSDPLTFAKSVAKFGYYGQQAHYSDGIKACGLSDDPEFAVRRHRSHRPVARHRGPLRRHRGHPPSRRRGRQVPARVARMQRDRHLARVPARCHRPGPAHLAALGPRGVLRCRQLLRDRGEPMIDMSETTLAKVDQLNAEDLITGPPHVPDHPGLAGWPPTTSPLRSRWRVGRPTGLGSRDLSMRRVLKAAWGNDGETYVGKRLTLFNDTSVRFGGDRRGRHPHQPHVGPAQRSGVQVGADRDARARRRSTRWTPCSTPPPHLRTAPRAAAERVAAETSIAVLERMAQVSGPERRAQIEQRVADLQNEPGAEA